MIVSVAVTLVVMTFGPTARAIAPDQAPEATPVPFTARVATGLLAWPAMRSLSRPTMNFLLALTVGLLVFLLIDTIGEGLEAVRILVMTAHARTGVLELAVEGDADTAF